MSSPWGKIQQPEPVIFTDILSEQLAKNIQEKETNTRSDSSKPESSVLPSDSTEYLIDNIPTEVLKALSDDTVESDATIAQILQMQYYTEYDNELYRKEKQINGNSKVSISYENFKIAPHENAHVNEQPKDDDMKKDWDRFDSLQRDINSIPGCGYKINQDGSMVTKHDLVNSGRKNACKLLSFPPEFQTGDGESFDLKLSNKVYNSLKLHAKKEEDRRCKNKDKKKDRATVLFSFDPRTNKSISNMLSSGLITSLNGVISIGKEAAIMHVNLNPNFAEEEVQLPKECVCKVFKTTLSEFKTRSDYIKDDLRFKDRIGNQTSQKVIHIWAEKEVANLNRLSRAGIKCPKPLILKYHILFLTLIGNDGVAAPKLKDAELDEAQFHVAYEEVIENMKKMYHEANLVHADLSEFNILWYQDSCHFIDVSQSVLTIQENAFFFLYRDCRNVINFFTKKGLSNIITPEELFKDIVGCDFEDKVALLAIRESFKMKPHLFDHPDIHTSFDFDSVWSKLEKGELPK